MAGYSAPATPWLKIEPNLLYKTDVSASRLDINVNLKWFDKFWVGGTVRTVRGLQPAILAGLQWPLMPGDALMLKAGYSYDFPVTVVSGGGSHEIVLGACFTPKVKKETSYGDTRYWGY